MNNPLQILHICNCFDIFILGEVNTMSVGERIKTRRKALKMTVDELALKLGRNRATVYRYESEEIENLSITVIPPLASALQTTPAYLMGWEDPVIAAIPVREHKTISRYLKMADKSKIDDIVDLVFEKEFGDTETDGLPPAVINLFPQKKKPN